MAFSAFRYDRLGQDVLLRAAGAAGDPALLPTPALLRADAFGTGCGGGSPGATSEKAGKNRGEMRRS